MTMTTTDRALMPTPGDTLLELASRAEHTVLLVAPFVKYPVLHRVFDVIPAHIQVCCVTRWDPIEIVAGVSDLEVWDLVKRRAHTELRLRMNLHAKLYRADRRCLVGSANLTGAALGWTRPANLELLVEVSADDPQVVQLEAELTRSSVVVSQVTYDTMLRAVESLRALGSSDSTSADPQPVAETATTPVEAWLPTCRAPDRLFSVYRGHEDRMISSAVIDAKYDLSILQLPAGLDRKSFTSYVTTLLEQHPVIRQLDDFVVTPRNPQEVQDFLAEHGTIPEGMTAADAWDALKLWLLAFFPDRYRAKPPQGTELFLRGTRLI